MTDDGLRDGYEVGEFTESLQSRNSGVTSAVYNEARMKRTSQWSFAEFERSRQLLRYGTRRKRATGDVPKRVNPSQGNARPWRAKGGLNEWNVTAAEQARAAIQPLEARSFQFNQPRRQSKQPVSGRNPTTRRPDNEKTRVSTEGVNA